MNRKVITTLVLLVGVLLGSTFTYQLGLSATTQHEGNQHLKAQQSTQSMSKKKEHSYHSQYVGQEDRSIKALPPKDIAGLKKGSGTPFGGMAKPAELNGIPGPKHVLDMIEAEKLKVTQEQESKIRSVYKKMKSDAISKGEALIRVEKEIDDGFENRSISEEELQEKIDKGVDLYGDLRNIHLKTHLEMLSILNQEQIKKYNKVRGYTDKQQE